MGTWQGACLTCIFSCAILLEVQYAIYLVFPTNVIVLLPMPYYRRLALSPPTCFRHPIEAALHREEDVNCSISAIIVRKTIELGEYRYLPLPPRQKWPQPSNVWVTTRWTRVSRTTNTELDWRGGRSFLRRSELLWMVRWLLSFCLNFPSVMRSSGEVVPLWSLDSCFSTLM
jgi:hypothetical protein